MKAVLCAALALSASAVELRGTSKIEPELKDYPLSDKPGMSHDDFFDKDNPHDDRLGNHEDFNHKYPFPKVQSVSKYEDDYTKDENSDNGEWQAQMNYDIVRNKIRAKELLVKEAADSERTEEEQLATATQTKEDAEANATKANAAASAAEASAETANEKLERLAGKPGETNVGEIAVARDATEKAIKKFADCEEELREAKKALAGFVEARDNATAAAAAAAAAGNGTNATDIKQVVEEKKTEVETAEKAVETEEANVEDLHAKLKKAEEHLEEVRKIHSASARKGAYPGAGEEEPAPAPAPPPKPSSATRSMGSAAAAVLLAALAAASA